MVKTSIFKKLEELGILWEIDDWSDWAQQPYFVAVLCYESFGISTLVKGEGDSRQEATFKAICKLPSYVKELF